MQYNAVHIFYMLDVNVFHSQLSISNMLCIDLYITNSWMRTYPKIKFIKFILKETHSELYYIFNYLTIYLIN